MSSTSPPPEIVDLSILSSEDEEESGNISEDEEVEFVCVQKAKEATTTSVARRPTPDPVSSLSSQQERQPPLLHKRVPARKEVLHNKTEGLPKREDDLQESCLATKDVADPTRNDNGDDDKKPTGWCLKCTACTTPRCGVCSACHNSTFKCVFRPCAHHPLAVIRQLQELAKTTIIQSCGSEKHAELQVKYDQVYGNSETTVDGSNQTVEKTPVESSRKERNGTTIGTYSLNDQDSLSDESNGELETTSAKRSHGEGESPLKQADPKRIKTCPDRGVDDDDTFNEAKSRGTMLKTPSSAMRRIAFKDSSSSSSSSSEMDIEKDFSEEQRSAADTSAADNGARSSKSKVVPNNNKGKEDEHHNQCQTNQNKTKDLNKKEDEKDGGPVAAMSYEKRSLRILARNISESVPAKGLDDENCDASGSDGDGDAVSSSPSASTVTKSAGDSPDQKLVRWTTRCNNCIGCSQPRCGQCTLCISVKNGTQCAFRPCKQHSKTCVTNLKRCALKVLALPQPPQTSVSKDSSISKLQRLFERIYGATADEKPAPTTSVSVSSSSHRYYRRCGDCRGCKRLPCGICSGCRNGTMCGFRPCNNLSPSTLLNLRRRANGVILRAETGKNNQELISLANEMYGEENGWVDMEGNRNSKQETDKKESGTAKAPHRAPRSASSCGNNGSMQGSSSSPQQVKRGLPCKKCHGCVEAPCGTCKPCKKASGSNTVCAFIRCENVVYAPSTWRTYEKLAQNALKNACEKDKKRLQSRYEGIYGARGMLARARGHKENVAVVGTRVYCKWPDNGMWYFGIIFSKTVSRQGNLYDVHFDDDTVLKKVRADGFITQEEYDEEWEEGSWAVNATKLFVGSLCYVRYPNDEWYWGVVEEIGGEGQAAAFSIYFPVDGDRLEGLPRMEVMSREEYYNSMKSLPKPGCYDIPAESIELISAPGSVSFVSKSLSTLRATRCRTCAMCLKDDCGKCQSCAENEKNTRPTKLLCLKKMCLRASEDDKCQAIESKFPQLKKFKFYFTTSENIPVPLKREESAHPELDGLVIVGPTGVFRTLEKAVSSDRIEKGTDLFRQMMSHFYQNILGVDMIFEEEHALVNKGFYNKWRNSRGTIKEAYGIISQCTRHLHDSKRYFRVQFHPRSARTLKVAGLCGGNRETWDGIDEADALGGYLAWLEALEKRCDIPKNPKFHRRYLVPAFVARQCNGGDFDILSFAVRGFQLELKAAKSKIPNSGLGLWIRASCLDLRSPRKQFMLEKGDFVDLGVYAPLVQQDIKTNSILLLKSLIHPNCEGWCFDSLLPTVEGNHGEMQVYDITCDNTGELHERSRQNILVYANETDGVNHPTIRAFHDPEGAVHYGFGSDASRLRIPANDSWTELMIDYGPNYEKVRVMKNYPRIQGKELEEMKQVISEDEKDIVRELKSSSVAEIVEAIEFLESVLKGWQRKPLPKLDSLQRALLAAVTLQSRLKEIVTSFEEKDDMGDDASFCENGYITVGENHTQPRLRALTTGFCDLFRSSEELKRSLIDKDLFFAILAQPLRLKDPGELKEKTPIQLKNAILSL